MRFLFFVHNFSLSLFPYGQDRKKYLLSREAEQQRIIICHFHKILNLQKKNSFCDLWNTFRCIFHASIIKNKADFIKNYPWMTVIEVEAHTQTHTATKTGFFSVNYEYQECFKNLIFHCSTAMTAP